MLLDYKTDLVEHAEELKERYATQLDWYAQALERLYGKTGERLLYSFRLKEVIKV